MQDWIKEKLNRIDELYSPERIAASKRRWTDIWQGRFPEDRLPFVCFPQCMDYYNDLNAAAETDLRLRGLLDECILHGHLNDDFIPSLFPGCRQSTIPNMFDVEEVVVGNDYTCRKILKNPEDIDRLPEPSIKPGLVAWQWLDRQAEWLEKTGGRLPIHVVDMQGPMDAAAQIFGYDELFVSAYTDPDRFNVLMGRFSDAFSIFWDAQKKLLGDLFVPTHLFGWTWVPPNSSVSLSADCLVMISPAFFDEHFKPHIDRISKEFGGIVVHSCGDFSHVVGSLQQLHNFRGINASQLSLKQLQEAGLHKDAVAIFLTDYASVFEEVDRIKQTRQLAQLSVQLAPDDLIEKPGNEWSRADLDRVLMRQDILLEQLAL